MSVRVVGGLRRGVVVACLGLVGAAAMTVSGCSGPTRVAEVTSTDAQGLCAQDLADGHVDCWKYSPEFPSEHHYRTGECIRLTQAYKYSGPPHTARVACPSGSGSTASTG